MLLGKRCSIGCATFDKGLVVIMVVCSGIGIS